MSLQSDAFGHAAVLTVAVHVDGRVGRREGAEGGEWSTLGKNPTVRDQRVARRQIRVDARERAEPCEIRNFVLRQARDVAGAIAILRRLLRGTACP